MWLLRPGKGKILDWMVRNRQKIVNLMMRDALLNRFGGTSPTSISRCGKTRMYPAPIRRSRLIITVRENPLKEELSLLYRLLVRRQMEKRKTRVRFALRARKAWMVKRNLRYLFARISFNTTRWLTKVHLWTKRRINRLKWACREELRKRRICPLETLVNVTLALMSLLIVLLLRLRTLLKLWIIPTGRDRMISRSRHLS